MNSGSPRHELVDQHLQEEIAGLAEVLSVVAAASGPLSQDEVDDALGVSAEQDEDDQS